MTEPINIVKKFWNFYEQNQGKELLVVYGGSGGGKSHSICQRLVYDFFRVPGINVLIVRKTSPSLKATTQRMILDIISSWNFVEGKDYTYNRTDRELYCPATKSLIRFSSVDDPAKLKSSSYNVAYCEEVTELDKEDFFFIQNTIRRPAPTDFKNKIIVSFNPVSRYHWCYQKFIETAEPKTSAILHSVYKDNPFLPKEYRDQLEALADQDENFYRVYCLGEPGVLDNAIYINFTVQQLNVPIQMMSEAFYGLDFGFNNPSCLVECVLRDGQPHVRERIYESHLTNSDLITRIGEMKISKEAPIYCDAAEPARIEELKSAGYNVIPADKSVKDGIDYVKRNKLVIDADSTNLVTEIRAYSYRKKGDQVLDEPVKFRDHAMDALRYALYTHAKLQGDDTIPVLISGGFSKVNTQVPGLFRR